MHMVVYERDKLYEEVWAEPVMKVAERYGVSGVGLAKTCRKLNVPLPPRGYWAKIKAGKTPRRSAPDGRIVATIADYGIVRELIADLVADEVGATVPATVVETVCAVVALAGKHKDGVNYLQLGERLGLDKSTASRRAKVAIAGGYLANLEEKKSKPARLVPGDPLPSEVVILPTVETLTSAVMHRDGGQSDHSDHQPTASPADKCSAEDLRRMFT